MLSTLIIFISYTKGDKKIEGFDISSERAFRKIIEQREERKATIEKRLIENDDDSLEERINHCRIVLKKAKDVNCL